LVSKSQADGQAVSREPAARPQTSAKRPRLAPTGHCPHHRRRRRDRYLILIRPLGPGLRRLSARSHAARGDGAVRLWDARVSARASHFGVAPEERVIRRRSSIPGARDRRGSQSGRSGRCRRAHSLRQSGEQCVHLVRVAEMTDVVSTPAVPILVVHVLVS